MKKCPQCGTVYADEIDYCLNDGAALIADSFSLPSSDEEEPETIVRNEPIIIDFGKINEPPVNPTIPTPAENVVIIPARADSPNRNYALFLVIGLLIGGGLVLATLLLAKTFGEKQSVDETKLNINSASNVKSETPKPTTQIENKNENKNESVALDSVPNKHAEPDDDAAENSNGRVIALNARVRLAPDKNAPVVDVLPMNDRLDIIRRENPSSPWYQVECEHGTGGWMHGDTIEFTR